jgi:UDPglucose--hexose-1-phosphate uridylyltransferase
MWSRFTRRSTARGTNGFQFHIEIHPSVRRPNSLKYLAGPEIGGGNFLSDTAPESKAEGIAGATRH